jgi:hypothetical protein
MADDQGYEFHEHLPTLLGEYVASLPEHERAYARTLEG